MACAGNDYHPTMAYTGNDYHPTMAYTGNDYQSTLAYTESASAPGEEYDPAAAGGFTRTSYTKEVIYKYTILILSFLRSKT